MPMLHDPYLDTARRSLDEEKIKLRKKKIEDSTTTSKSFFSKNIIISDYIHLPENFQSFFLISLFIFIPYLCGTLILLVILKEYANLDIDSFMIAWTIGYEVIAFILLLIIMKSALYFKKTSN